VLAFLAVLLALHCFTSNRVLCLNGVLPLQQNGNSISGHVSDNQRTPIADLRVELLNEVDTVIQTSKTDGSGLFVFRKLSDGTFQVRVQTYGTNYVSQTKRVELSRPSGFGVAFEEVDFALSTVRGTSSSSKPGVVFAQDVPEQARKQYQKATELLQKERRQEGFAALSKAIEIYPQYFDALEMLGSEHVKQQEYEHAIPPLKKAVEINVRAYPSWYALGVAQYNLKLLPEAVESLRRAVSLNEKSINANLWLGTLLRHTGRLDEAETFLKQANLLAEAKVADAHWQLALLFNQLKRFKEAADELELFLKFQPDARDADKIKKLIQRLREQTAAAK
jgi:Carboxypeptidase regulatory-like domain/Tetratricopeptide repeat